MCSAFVLASDITDRKKIEDERSALIAELKEKNAELEQFIYTVSHDLKAPLITIRGFLGFLEQDLQAGYLERMQNDISRISDAADRMQRLIIELLDLSRVGRIMNPSKSVPFEVLVHDAIDMVAGQIAIRGVRIDIAPDLPTIHGDRVRLTQALQNLLDNAAKYMGSQTNPQIEIGLRRLEGAKGIFFVRDNGIGIAPQYHERVFGLFNKLDPTSDGTGVGLALVKRIIEFHGGQIWVESEGDNRGSIICFTLQISPNAETGSE